MSVARPLKCLLSRRLASAAARPATAAPQCFAASFHSSAPLEKRKTRFANVRAKEMGLLDDAAVDEFTKQQFKPYSPEELEILKKHYTPEQMEVLEAGEAAIDPKDLTIQGRLRRDPYKLPYLDDFSQLVPSIDREPKKHAPPNPNARWLTEEEAMIDLLMGHSKDLMPLLRWAGIPEEKWATMPEAEKKQIKAELQKFIKEHQEAAAVPEPVQSTKTFMERSMLNDNNAPSNSALAPSLGKKIPGVSGMYKNPIDPEDQGLDDDGVYQELKRRTGMTVRQMMDLSVKILVTRIVHNQTRLGKIRSMWIMAIAGNKNGRLGIGEAKSTEIAVSTIKAKLLAIRNMQPIRRYEDRTIHGDVEAKVGATIVRLNARPPGKDDCPHHITSMYLPTRLAGFGLRVPARLFEMFRACGIHDIAGHMPRSRNPMNSVKATFQALTNQKDPNEIAVGRGKKLVDVRNVYYGGNVL
ncbi:uncharacterized protein JN550_007181 [Neoarthrinium moseri]|uniref:uncharacterized protein n=1 Tax=Neoarthrinium moseri TaxID=1658444 RepID=UPI001FDD31B4|nr:uncharacterized protein JN550_007181 [Neoarthrinium moseri]KAI1867129.1 hypothetical protein JN550_007181 [Neoarthrinium moseri]